MLAVRCPKCDMSYQSVMRASINSMLDNFSSERIDKMPSATCPACWHKVALDILVVRTKACGKLLPSRHIPKTKLNEA